MVTTAPELTEVNYTTISFLETYFGTVYGMNPSKGGWRVRLADNILVSLGRTVTSVGYTVGFNIWDLDTTVWNDPQIAMRTAVELNDGSVQIASGGAFGPSAGRVWWNSELRRLAYLLPKEDSASAVDPNQLVYGLVEFTAGGDYTVISSGTINVSGALAYVNGMDHLLLVASTDLETVQAVWMGSQGTGTAGNRARLQTNTFDLTAGTGGTWSTATVVPTELGLADADPNNWYGFERGVDRDYASVGDAAADVEVVVGFDGSLNAYAHEWDGGSAITGADFVVDGRLPFKERQHVGTDYLTGQHVENSYESILCTVPDGDVPAWMPYLDAVTELGCDWWANGDTEVYGTDASGKATFLKVSEDLSTIAVQYQTAAPNGSPPLRTEREGRYRWNYNGGAGRIQVFYQTAVAPEGPGSTTLEVPVGDLPPLRIPFPTLSRTFERRQS